VLLAFQGEVGDLAFFARNPSTILSAWFGGTTLSSHVIGFQLGYSQHGGSACFFPDDRVSSCSVVPALFAE
jgi:hypothetical protein